ncbi:hypothetical protein [Nonomuraea sp. SBT364]|uniref:hypothetical protein n=1 Tax=Nonomuraea sp. SBT364 TaxID=1580530 RepID=UPI00066AE62F|nr:hypothetical protein [Nonomuraea sp. SBT364]
MLFLQLAAEVGEPALPVLGLALQFGDAGFLGGLFGHLDLGRRAAAQLGELSAQRFPGRPRCCSPAAGEGAIRSWARSSALATGEACAVVRARRAAAQQTSLPLRKLSPSTRERC